MLRRGAFIGASLVVVVLSYLLSAGSASADPVTFAVKATAAAVVPTPGPAGASGSATFTVNDSTGQICYQLSETGITAPEGAHIHQGAAGTVGPIVVVLDISKLNTTGQSCTASTPAIASAIIANPSNYYMIIHTMQYDAGAIRGQLTRAPDGVNAGSGGRAAPSDQSTVVLLALLGVGVLLCLGFGWQLVARRPFASADQ
jgi:hypothetical protein